MLGKQQTEVYELCAEESLSRRSPLPPISSQIDFFAIPASSRSVCVCACERRYVGRHNAASPATGNKSSHIMESSRIMKKAFEWLASRSTHTADWLPSSTLRVCAPCIYYHRYHGHPCCLFSLRAVLWISLFLPVFPCSSCSAGASVFCDVTWQYLSSRDLCHFCGVQLSVNGTFVNLTLSYFVTVVFCKVRCYYFELFVILWFRLLLHPCVRCVANVELICLKMSPVYFARSQVVNGRLKIFVLQRG